eukprot:gene8872-821_t
MKKQNKSEKKYKIDVNLLNEIDGDHKFELKLKPKKKDIDIKKTIKGMKKKDEKVEKIKENKDMFRKKEESGIYFNQSCVRENKIKLNQEGGGFELYGFGSEGYSSLPIQCRCMNCELRLVIPKLKECQNLYLIDLDNFGLKEFTFSIEGKNYFKSSFLWLFHGSGLRDRSKSNENEKDIFDYLQSNKYNQKNMSLSKNSIFNHFLKNDSLRLSPCGWSSQAADEAMVKIFKIFKKKMNIIVISKDKLFLQQIQSILINEKIQGSLLIDTNGKSYNEIFNILKNWKKK